MLSKFENKKIVIITNSKGAELTSMRLKGDDTEYIWQADANYWGRHAPVLFPIVGRLKDNRYIYGGNTYKLNQHGFARDKDFDIMDKSDTSILYVLKSNAETKEVYPFDFELKIKYEICENRVMIRYYVLNTGLEDMYFSIGAHPGFNCPLHADEKLEDCYIEFDNPETINTSIFKEGTILDMRPAFKNTSVISLSKDLFKNDAMIIQGMKSKSISIKSKKSKSCVSVECGGFPYLGIWSNANGGNFVCIEPWYGITDSFASTGKLEEKKGIQKISKGQTFKCGYSIEIE